MILRIYRLSFRYIGLHSKVWNKTLAYWENMIILASAGLQQHGIMRNSL